MREYDQIVDWYVATRDPEIGVAAVASLVEGLPRGATVLDLGCGDGVPISRELTRQGFVVTALDSSPEMIARYRGNFPSVEARCAPVQEVEFAAESFDAVVAWGVLFHLPVEEQKSVIAKVATWLKPGGRFLFTSGATDDASEGEMDGVMFPYRSMSVDGYREELEAVGMRLESHDRDAWGNHVYLSVR